MCVNGDRQTVVEVLRLWQDSAAEVQRLGHAPCGNHSEHDVEVRVGGDDAGIQGFGKGLATVDFQAEALKNETDCLKRNTKYMMCFEKKNPKNYIAVLF